MQQRFAYQTLLVHQGPTSTSTSSSTSTSTSLIGVDDERLPTQRLSEACSHMPGAPSTHYHKVIYLRCLIQGGLYVYVCMYARTYVDYMSTITYHVVIYPRGSYRPCIQGRSVPQGGLCTSYRAAYIPEPQRMQQCHSRRRHLAGEPHSTLATVLPRGQTH